MDSIYSRIKERRIQLGLSQEALALKLGYRGRDSISKIESGKQNLTQSKVLDIAKALNTTAAYLLGEESEASPVVSADRQKLIDAVSNLTDEQVTAFLKLIQK